MTARLRLPGAPLRRPKVAITRARAIALRVLARCDYVDHVVRDRGSISYEVTDGKAGLAHTLPRQTLESLVRLDLVTVAVGKVTGGTGRRYALTPLGRAICRDVDLSDTRRDAALAADLDAAFAALARWPEVAP